MAKLGLFHSGRSSDPPARCREWAQAVNLAEDATRRLSDTELQQAINMLKQRHSNEDPPS